MHYIIFGTIALIFFIVSYLVGIKKCLDLIYTFEEKALKNHKNLIIKIFTFYYLLLGCIALLCPWFINFYGDLGILISTIVLLGFFSLSILIPNFI